MKRIIDTALKILLIIALIGAAALLFTGPFMQATTYYIALSVCFAVIIGWCFYFIETNAKGVIEK